MRPFKFLISLALVISFTSCTVQKRLYRNGYSVHWNSKIKISKSDEINNEFETTISELKEDDKDLALTTNDIILERKSLVSLSNEKLELKKNQNEMTVDPPKCDTMLMRNGEKILVNVIEISPIDVKFKRCDNLEGPTKMINKYYISAIHYSDGTIDVFKTEESIKPIQAEENSKSHSTESGAAILSLLFGILSILLYVFTIAFILNFLSFDVFDSFIKVFLPFTILSSVFAIILGASYLSKVRREPNIYKRESSARAGLILGTFSLLILLLLIFAALILF